MKLDKDSLEIFKQIQEECVFEKFIVPPGEDFCTAIAIPLVIEDLIYGCVCLVPGEYTVHKDDVVEIVAPVKIIDELD